MDGQGWSTSYIVRNFTKVYVITRLYVVTDSFPADLGLRFSMTSGWYEKVLRKFDKPDIKS